MAEDSSELFVAGDGHIYVAPFGTTLPNDIDDELDADFVELGYLTEDGFRMTPSITTVDIHGWQSAAILRKLVTARDITLGLDFLQSNEEVFKLYFGGGSFTDTVYTPPGASEIDERSLVADVFDGDREWRFWFPKVTLSAARELAFKRTDASKWGVDLATVAVGTDPLFGFDSDDAEFPAYPD